jgi:hypothetical protein
LERFDRAERKEPFGWFGLRMQMSAEFHSQTTIAGGDHLWLSLVRA